MRCCGARALCGNSAIVTADCILLEAIFVFALLVIVSVEVLIVFYTSTLMSSPSTTTL
jgi:hypothetical protein